MTWPLRGACAGSWLLHRAGLARVASASFALGVVLAALFQPRPELPLAILGMIAAGVLLLSRAVATLPASRSSLVPAVVLCIPVLALAAGFALGSERTAELTRSRLADLSGRPYAAVVEVLGPVKEKGGQTTSPARVKRPLSIDRGMGEKVLVEVKRGGGKSGLSGFEEGALLEIRGIISVPRSTSSTGFDFRTHLQRQGIAVVLEASTQEVWLRGHRGGVAGLLDRARVRARRHLSQGINRETATLFQGMMLGETQGLSDKALDDFRRSGTAHILSVSGLHVASLAAAILGVAWLARLPRLLGHLLAGLLVAFFVPLTGSGTPAVRAAVMLVLVLLAQTAGRGRDRWQALLVAAVTVLAVNPFAAFGASFQLSFGAMASLFAFSRPLERGLGRLGVPLAGPIAVSLAAGLATTPLSLVAFGRASLVGVAANLVVVPIMPAIMALGLASIGGGLVWLPLSGGLNLVAAALLSWATGAAAFFARFPVLEAEDWGRAVAAGLGAAATTPLALRVAHKACSWLLSRRRCPSPSMYHRARFVLAGTLIVVGLGMGWLAFPLGAAAWRSVDAHWHGREWPAETEVRILDVGEGNAVLVRTPRRHALLFDGGPRGSNLGGQLRRLGVRKLDVVVVSHPHSDHFGGLLETLGQVPVGMIIDQVDLSGTNGEGSDDGESGRAQSSSARYGSDATSYRMLRDELRKAGAGYRRADDGMVLRIDEVEVRLLASRVPVTVKQNEIATGTGARADGEALNAASLVATVRAGGLAILLPGDAETGVLERYALPRVDGIVVPHHGSRGAVSSHLLDRLGARVACISVGANNSFGHPDPETLEVLGRSGLRVLRTDRSGWVAVRLANRTLKVTTEKSHHEQPDQ